MPAGSISGANYIRAWNDNNWKSENGNAGWAIIDCTMNLSLLFWASEEIRDPANLPEDLVPYWDFHLTTQEGAPRDSSAAAIAASGLLLLEELLPAEEGRLYGTSARRILQSMAEHYAIWDPSDEAILLHGTGHWPANKNIDVGLIYGDYYFVEAAWTDGAVLVKRGTPTASKPYLKKMK